MRRWVAFLAFVVLGILVVGPATRGGEEKGPLVPGANVPGTFHPYNVNVALPPPSTDPDEKPKAKAKYTTKGKFHCLISEYDLDPVVMLFAHNLDTNKGFRDLLKSLDSALDRHRIARLRSFVVFVYDKEDPKDPDFRVAGKPDVKADDLKKYNELEDRRQKIAGDLEKMVGDLGLKQVVVTFAGKKDLEAYALKDEHALTAVLYKDLRIASVHRLTLDQLNEPESPQAKAILEAADKLAARK